ncbi:GATA zinc finger domain-containing protein 14-like [Lucilia sericata]|uniref:GATA zinc finger domain-containing protein 14-like n=1 Tax=Lucilia sericata TaxID=13632 RepID=UPI0018A8065C|nr:GATA zinc finger domain-containing protein 14-like [Lucilia sericata]XP_037809873.1 GATA zinc finger domain-containing protein 14-like [Lucilia sericata]XP_037809874.1 GATA zinc finger domain-containing protein 14-like [Lucilia sericata]XP_037809875.1 GATA zinc finger domain-containing protein 14-like [Lucilia sericata]
MLSSFSNNSSCNKYCLGGEASDSNRNFNNDYNEKHQQQHPYQHHRTSSSSNFSNGTTTSRLGAGGGSGRNGRHGNGNGAGYHDEYDEPIAGVATSNTSRSSSSNFRSSILRHSSSSFLCNKPTSFKVIVASLTNEHNNDKVPHTHPHQQQHQTSTLSTLSSALLTAHHQETNNFWHSSHAGNVNLMDRSLYAIVTWPRFMMF